MAQGEGEERRREEEGDAHVERVHLAEQHVERAAGEHRRRVKPKRRAEEPIGGDEDHGNAGEADERGPQARHPILFSN